MNRVQLEHLIRAACAVSDDTEVVIIGSQAVLGQYPSAPVELLQSLEADLYPKNYPERSDLVDGALGELSMFHSTFGYYADGVSPQTATLPAGWAERLVPICNENTMPVARRTSGTQPLLRAPDWRIDRSCWMGWGRPCSMVSFVS